MSFDRIFDLTAGVYFYFYDTYIALRARQAIGVRSPTSQNFGNIVGEVHPGGREARRVQVDGTLKKHGLSHTRFFRTDGLRVTRSCGQTE